MALVHLPDDIKSELSINEKGETSITLRGCSRLINVAHQALSNHFGGNFSSSKLAKNLTDKGVECGNFSENGIPDTAFVFICEYYAFDAGKRCTQEAKNLYRAFAAIGFRTWVQKELDWEPKKQETRSIDDLNALIKTGQAISALAQDAIEIRKQLYRQEELISWQRGRINIVERDIWDWEKRTQFLEASVEDAFKASRDARFYLKQIDESTSEDIEVAELTTRAKIRKIALSFAAAQNVHPRDVWVFLYRQFRDRYHYDAKKRSKNSGLNPLGQVEADGYIEDFYNMTVHCLITFPSLGWWNENDETIKRNRNDFDLD